MSIEIQKLSDYELENISGGMNPKIKYFLLGVLTGAISTIIIYDTISDIIQKREAKKHLEKANKYQRRYFGNELGKPKPKTVRKH